MVLNVSRVKRLGGCKRAAFNQYHRHLEGQRSMDLTDGSAFHEGVAEGQSSRDWSRAKSKARTRFYDDLKDTMYTEDDIESTMHLKVVMRAIELFEEHWNLPGMNIVQPECKFEVDIPNTWHNDISMHWRNVETGQDEWGMPDHKSILRRVVARAHEGEDTNCPCWRQHRLVGKTDGILSWQGFIWLQEHKTTSMLGPKFWAQWKLDLQPTAYVYGVSKTLNMTPKGVVMNALLKPSKQQYAQWIARTTKSAPKEFTEYMNYERDIVMRSPADLDRFEREFAQYCDEWEWRILSGNWPMMPSNNNCFAWNRQCEYFELCESHEDEQYFQLLSARKLDYVDEERQHLVQLATTKGA